MEVSPEIIDIGNLGDDNIVELKPSTSFDDELDTEEFNKPSVNFGSGIELLMNDKKPNEGKSKRSDIKIDDLENLEDELNTLADNIDIDGTANRGKSSGDNIFQNLFNFGNDKKDENRDTKKSVQETESRSDKNLGKSTADYNDTKSWDGYGKFNDVPITKDNIEKPKLTREEELREKFKYLQKLEALEKKGATLTQRYSMESNLDEMIG